MNAHFAQAKRPKLPRPWENVLICFLPGKDEFRHHKFQLLLLSSAMPNSTSGDPIDIPSPFKSVDQHQSIQPVRLGQSPRWKSHSGTGKMGNLAAAKKEWDEHFGFQMFRQVQMSYLPQDKQR